MHKRAAEDHHANGFGAQLPGGYGLLAAAVIEVVMTFGFVTVILGVTDRRAVTFAPAAPLAIGLALTLIHLISIPVTNTSVNPARSTAPALFVGGPRAGAALAVLGGVPRRRRDRRPGLRVARPQGLTPGGPGAKMAVMGRNQP